MSLPTLIEKLSDDGIMEIDTLNASIELMKIEKLRETLSQDTFNDIKLQEVLEATGELSDMEKTAYSKMAELSKRERQCYLLYIIENMSMQKIADKLNLSKWTVRTYIDRAKDKLSQNLP